MVSTNMSMQTITAYKYYIVDNLTKQPLVSGDGTNGTICIRNLLDEFSEQMKKPQISRKSQKILTLEKNPLIKSSVAEQRFHFRATAGRFGQRTVAINVEDKNERTELGTENAICHFYNVFFYVEYGTKNNVCIFHRYGRGGCKTVFLEMFKTFLKERNLSIEMLALVSPNNESIIEKGQKTKIRLLKNTAKVNHSPDVADNIVTKKVCNNTEMELTINLKNKRVASKIGDVNDIVLGRKKISEVYEIPDDFDYDQTMVEMLIGNQKKTLDLSRIGVMLCEYDITDKLEYDKDNEPTYETISTQADEYYNTQMKKVVL